MSVRQIPLAFPHVPHYAAADFVAAEGNRLARAWLSRTDTWPHGRLALWGAAGSGKTHLLHVWAAAQGGAVLRPDALPRWPAGPLAVDDAGRARPEPLLHLLNAAAESRLPLLLASRLPPARRRPRLADLASRLRATTAVRLAAADDAFLATLLARLLSDRQLSVPAAVQAWLLTRLPRTPAAIRAAVARLDQAALAAGRSVSRPFAAHVLSGLLHGDLPPLPLPAPDKAAP